MIFCNTDKQYVEDAVRVVWKKWHAEVSRELTCKHLWMLWWFAVATIFLVAELSACYKIQVDRMGLLIALVSLLLFLYVRSRSIDGVMEGNAFQDWLRQIDTISPAWERYRPGLFWKLVVAVNACDDSKLHSAVEDTRKSSMISGLSFVYALQCWFPRLEN